MDDPFEVFFWFFLGIGLLIAVVTVIVMVGHFAVFGLIFKRIWDARATQAAATAERRCTHCGTVIAASAAACPSCGAPAA